MAVVIPLVAQAALPPQLLAELAPNDPISSVSIWPLAIGYWIVLSLLLAVIAFAVVYWLRSKKVRLNLKRLKTIQKSPPHANCRDVHLLLRSILQQHNAELACCNEREFANYVMTTLTLDTQPYWLNAHYRNEVPTTMPWTDIRKLVTQWSKEVPR